MVAMTTDNLPEWLTLNDALEIVARHVGKTSNIFVYIKQDMTEAAAPQREAVEDDVLDRLDAAFNDGYAKGYAFGQKRAVEVDDAMVERALNAPLGLTTKVAHMLMYPDQHDPEKGPKWKHALMRSALTAALTPPQGDNDA